MIRSGSAEKTCQSGHGGSVGGLREIGGDWARSAGTGSGDTSWVCRLETIVGAEADNGCSGVAHDSADDHCGECCNGEGGSLVGEGTGGRVGGGDDGAGEGDVLERGERRRSSFSPRPSATWPHSAA
jgi:hypothetical protein